MSTAHKTRQQDRVIPGRTREAGTRTSEAGTRNNKAERDRDGKKQQERSGQDGGQQNRAGTGKTREDMEDQDRTGQGKTGQDKEDRDRTRKTKTGQA